MPRRPWTCSRRPSGVAPGGPPGPDSRGVLAGERCSPQLARGADHYQSDAARPVGRVRARGCVRHASLVDREDIDAPVGRGRFAGRWRPFWWVESGSTASAWTASTSRSWTRRMEPPVILGGDPRQRPHACGLPALPDRDPAHPRRGPAAEGPGRPGVGDRDHGRRPGGHVRRVARRTRTLGGDRARDPRRVRDRRPGDPRPPFSGVGGSAARPASGACRPRSWSTPPRGTCVRS